MVSFTDLFHILIFTGVSLILTLSPAVLILIQLLCWMYGVAAQPRGEDEHEQRTLPFDTVLIHCFGVRGFKRPEPPYANPPFY